MPIALSRTDARHYGVRLQSVSSRICSGFAHRSHTEISHHHRIRMRTCPVPMI